MIQMSTNDQDGHEILGETNTGKPKDIQQYTYAQKALFKLHLLIELDLLEILFLQKY